MLSNGIRLILALLVLLTSINATASEAEVKSFHVLFKLTLLEIVANKCGDNQYYKPEFWQDASRDIEAALLISLDDYRAILSRDTKFDQEVSNFKRRYTCVPEDAEYDLGNYAYDYDNALFELQIADALHAPLVESIYKQRPQEKKQEQVQQPAQKSPNQYLSGIVKRAKHIAVGMLKGYEFTPKTYKRRYGDDYSYIFKSDYGWKIAPEPYVPVTDETPEYMFSHYNSDKTMLTKNPNIEVLLITSADGKQIVLWVPLTNPIADVILENLGSKEWEYMGYRLKTYQDAD